MDWQEERLSYTFMHYLKLSLIRHFPPSGAPTVKYLAREKTSEKIYLGGSQTGEVFITHLPHVHTVLNVPVNLSPHPTTQESGMADHAVFTLSLA